MTRWNSFVWSQGDQGPNLLDAIWWQSQTLLPETFSTIPERNPPLAYRQRRVRSIKRTPREAFRHKQTHTGSTVCPSISWTPHSSHRHHRTGSQDPRYLWSPYHGTITNSELRVTKFVKLERGAGKHCQALSLSLSSQLARSRSLSSE